MVDLAELDRSRQIFSDESGKVVSWDGVEGGRLVEWKSETTLRRGVNIAADVAGGINAVFNQLKNIPVFTEIGGEASVRLQAQTPLDLFEEAGLAARIQAIARLAAGIGLKPTMSVKDMLDAVGGLPGARNGPYELVELLLEEVTIRGVLYAQAAIAIMAYANFVATGSVLPGDDGKKPGFQFVFEAGYGFKVGGGYRTYVEVGLDKPQRLLARLADEVVTRLIQAAVRRLPSDQRSRLLSLEAPLKMGARLAYEIGAFSKEQAHTSSTYIILEEGQSWILRRLAASQDPAVRWVSARLDNRLRHHILDSGGTPFSYNGDIGEQIPGEITKTINIGLGRNPEASLQLEDLAAYLFTGPLTALFRQSEEMKMFWTVFEAAFPGSPESGVRALFAASSGAVGADTGLLLKLTGGLQEMIRRQLSSPGFRESLIQALDGENEWGVLLQSALIPALELAADSALPYLTNQRDIDRKLLREALSSVLLALIGRSVIRIINGIVMGVQGRIGDLLRSAGNQLTNNAVMQILERAGAPFMRILRKPLQAGIEEAADHLDDFIPQSVFDQALAIFTPIGSISASDYLEKLRNPAWVPREAEARALALKLLEILTTRMQQFIPKILWAILQAFLEALKEELIRLVKQFAEVLKQFTNQLRDAISRNITEPLVKIIRSTVDPAVGRLPEPVRSAVRDVLDNTIRNLIPGLLSPLNNALATISFNPEKILDILSKPRNFNEFQEYIFEEIGRQLRQLNFNLEFDLNIPIKLTGPGGVFGGFGAAPSGVPGGAAGFGGIFNGGSLDPSSLDPTSWDPSSLDPSTWNIPGVGNPIDALKKVLSDAGFDDLLTDLAGNPLIPLGRFTLSPDKIVEAIREALSGVMRSLYSDLIPFAAPALQQMQKIADFQLAIPQIMAQFQTRLMPKYNTITALRSSSICDAVILLRPVHCFGNSPAIQVLLHYAGIDAAYAGSGYVAVYLNGFLLSPLTFHYAANTDGGLQGRPPGLLLWRTLMAYELLWGENVLCTVAVDSYGRRMEASTRFVFC
jgi:hypothetical protein